MTVTRMLNAWTLIASALFLAAVSMPTDASAKKKRRAKQADAATNAEPATSKAEAPANDPKAVARKHYAAGKALYDSGLFAEAEKEFQAAYDAKPHPVVLKSIAECQVQTGNLKAAIENLEKYLASPNTDDKAAVEARVAELRKTPSAVVVTSDPSGASIAVAGVDTGKVTPASLSLNPGEYAVTLSMDGLAPIQKNIEVTLGEPTELAVSFHEQAPTAEPEVAPAAGVDPFQEAAASSGPGIENDPNSIPTAFWALAAVAGAGLVSGTVFGTMALGDEDDYKQEPTQAKKEAGRRDAILADVSFGLAAAAAIAGTVIFVVHHKRSKTESAGLRVLPVAGQEQAGVVASFDF